jgi:ADP-ribosylglycohydrolase
MAADLKSKFMGTLLGCAVGDALGAPFEFKKGFSIRAVDNLGQVYFPFEKCPLGQYTDDTQLTLALAETYIANRGFKGFDFAKRLAEFWARGEIIGPGISCSEAVANLSRGKSWRNSGDIEGKAGNGTAMRASPVGLWNYDDHAQMKKDSIAQSQITHKDPRAKAGAAAVAFAVGYNLAHETIEPEIFSNACADFINDLSPEFSDYVRRLHGWLAKEEQIAVLEISCAGWLTPPRWIDQITPFVIPSVLIALYNFLRSPDDFTLTVKRTLQAGGDVDTTASIAGAISGSFTGTRGIPRSLAEDLYQSDMVANTGLRLFQAKHPES